MGKYQRKKKKRTGLVISLVVLLVLLLAAAGVMHWLNNRRLVYIAPLEPTEPTVLETAASETDTSQPETTEPETTAPPEPEHVVSTANLLSTGDLLMHMGLLKAGHQGDGSYDFSYLFPYLTEYVAAADYAVANLEVTLAGDAKPYQGYPAFNCPDSIVDAAKDAGFDMLLTANNHSYDTQQPGFERTIQTIRDKGLKNLGTTLSGDEDKYVIQDINGIKLGLICYTYETSNSGSNPPSLNLNPMKANGYDLVNCFRPGDPEPFYAELEERMAQMREDGAEAIILFIHWGTEYTLVPTDVQKAMAQRLCDLGVDVIVGGHPHVVEPLELLTSTVDPERKTVCLYSMGNAVSNQRLGELTSITTAHTEDGVLFSLSFEKYSDGTVYLAGVDLIPTWVRAIAANGKTVVRRSASTVDYRIIPLEDARREQWQSLFEVDDSTLTQLEESWQRTMDLVGDGLAQIREYLNAQKVDRDTNYLLLAGG